MSRSGRFLIKHLVDDKFRDRRKDHDHEGAQDGAREGSRPENGVAPQITEDPPDDVHAHGKVSARRSECKAGSRRHARRSLASRLRTNYCSVVIIQQIFISPGHNYFGHAGRPPDDFPLQEVDKIECVAGHGIRGDRFYDHKNDYHGQITFFSREAFDSLQMRFPDVDKSPGVLRRNVIVSGVDLNSLVGSEFELQGVRFLGTDHCRPCYWLDTAFAPGTKDGSRETAACGPGS